jgi:hypothetical protein
MSRATQTIVALGLVLVTVALLLRTFFTRRPGAGCGGACSAVSPEVKRLQARLKR